MVRTKPKQKIHVDKLKTTLDKLDGLENKPKDELTLRESIFFLRDKLNRALKKGYSFQDLSEILEEQEILISASTLKQYLTEIDKSKRSSSRRQKGKSVKSKQTGVAKSNSDSDGLGNSDDSDVLSGADSKQEELNSSQSIADKLSRAKSSRLSGSSRDLSSDFNQY